MYFEASPDFFDTLYNYKELIHYGGLTLLLIIIYAETGLFVGFVLPGDALLFTSGLLCGTEDLAINVFVLLVLVTLAAITGNITGYFTGKFLGPRLFKKDDSWFFKKKHLVRAKEFYKKYGGGSIIVGRFLPIVRTFVPIVAGAISMDFKRFNIFNITGAFLWVWSLISVGYFLGKEVPGILDHIEFIIFGIFIITTLILIRGYVKFKRTRKATRK